MKQYLLELGYDIEGYITDSNLVEEIYEAIADYILENPVTNSVLDYIESIGFSIDDFDEYLID